MSDSNNAIRVIDTDSSKVVTTLAGSGTSGTLDGTGTDAQFFLPGGLALDGTTLYVADVSSHRIRAIGTVSKVVTTFAGTTDATKGSGLGFVDATGTDAKFKRPSGIAISGTTMYVADLKNHDAIRVINTASKEVTTLAGFFGAVDGTGITDMPSSPYHQSWPSLAPNYTCRIILTEPFALSTPGPRLSRPLWEHDGRHFGH